MAASSKSSRYAGGGRPVSKVSESGYKTFRNAKEADEWATTNAGGAYLVSLPVNQQKSIADYTKAGYYGLNAMLRNNSKFDPDRVVDKAKVMMDLKNIDAAMAGNNAIMQEKFTVFRGWGDGFFDDKPVGSVFQDKGFVSTSIDPNHEWYGAPVAEIRVPRGARGLYIRSLGLKDEYEFLLNRGQNYKVVKNDSSGIIVEMIP